MDKQAYLPGLNVSELDLARVRALENLAEEANPGPCKVVQTREMTGWPICDCGADDGGAQWAVQTDGVHASELRGGAEEDAAFIAACYTEVPWLIALVRRLVKEAKSEAPA